MLDVDWAGREFAELWVYGDQRSCRLTPREDGVVAGAFLDRRTQLLRADALGPASAARMIEYWIDAAAPVAAMRDLAPGVELLPFAEDFERSDYAAWHWGNLLLRAEDDELLGFYRPLVERIAGSAALARYFSFTSLDRLCLSRSSLYPFDTEGLPVVVPARREGPLYAVLDRDREAVTVGHRATSFSPVTPQ